MAISVFHLLSHKSINIFFFCLFPVFRVYRGPGDGDMCSVPAAELGPEVGCAAGDDRHLLTTDRSVLHLAICSLRHSPPQHRVSVLESHAQKSHTVLYDFNVQMSIYLIWVLRVVMGACI